MHVLEFGRVKRLMPKLAQATPAFAGLLAALLWVLVFMAGRGGAHQVHHQQTQTGGDCCAVCLLLHGQLAGADAAVAAIRVAPAFEFKQALVSARPALPGRLLPPGRGPPILTPPL